ncbi:MAG: hypothetical protein RMK29_11380 [Myxococcales bacterium]|nr:hypothetical protein [Myxococcota bacterium]MDW8282309.1 hypothetical protein [Myxococcales bacterium]
MGLPVVTRSSPTRAGFCPRCDAPLYADEGQCRYCRGLHGPNPPPWEAMAMGVGAALLLGLAIVLAVRG